MEGSEGIYVTYPDRTYRRTCRFCSGVLLGPRPHPRRFTHAQNGRHSALLVSLGARPFLQNYAHAVVACARGGRVWYRANAGPGILISEGGPLISSGCKQKVKVQ